MVLASPKRSQNEASPSRPEKTVADMTDNEGTKEGGGGEESHVQDLILSCNRDGMDLLRSERNKDAFDHFKYAEAVLLANAKESDNTSLLAITCNNLGCYYMKIRKYHGALSYLRRALKMEVELKTDETTLAGTHLNLCAILSKLEKPRKAVQHALCALELMHKRISASESVVSQDDYATLAVAYHNIGQCRLMQVEDRVESSQTDQAATAFQTGYQIATRFLGEQHPITATLEKNCEAVLQKAKNAKVKSTTNARAERAQGTTNENLPEINPSARDLQAKDQDKLPEITIKGGASASKEAADWATSEEAAWENFAESTLRGTPPPRADQASPEAELDKPGDLEPLTTIDIHQGCRRLPPSSIRALAQMELQDLTMTVPQANDMGNFRFQQVLVEQQLKQTPLGQALEDHPEALMDIIDAEGEGQKGMRNTPNDYRPNRVIKRSTRTSRVVRRTGVFNSSAARDRVILDAKKAIVSTAHSALKSTQTQTLAAERIQRVWRAWFEYCQETSEWMTVTWICATMIQSHWRSYHVRRKKMDHFAGNIQRHCRGFLVRCVLNKHTAAVTIQRRVVGMITRKKLAHLHEDAIKIEKLVRGGLARRRFRDFRDVRHRTVTTIQKHIRVWLAKRRVARLALERAHVRMRYKATVDLQRMFRGWKGRQKVEAHRQLYFKGRLHDEAATRIQSAVRRRLASKRVDRLRGNRLDEMERAATFLRKVWLGVNTRKRYLKIKEEFKNAEGQVITIQRFIRGFLCRLSLWRDAVAAEDELWAVLQIQRRWRGYCGRVKAEDLLELVWRKEFGAAKVQRIARAWMARIRVNRMKRQIAHTEFKRARRRYQAQQKIACRTRGMLSRKVTNARKKRIVTSIVHIQRIFRGTLLRRNLWYQVRNQRAVMMQSLVRGFLVRNRRHFLLNKVRKIQRVYRLWLRLSKERREFHFAACRNRKQKATMIQRQFRLFAEAGKVRLIQDPSQDVQLRQRISEAREVRKVERMVKAQGVTA